MTATPALRLPDPRRFSVDDFDGFESVFAYNARYVPAAKLFGMGRDGRSLTYGAIDELTAGFCGWAAAQGLKPGDRAIILSADELAVTGLFLGCLRYGLTAVVLSPDSGVAELQSLIAAAQARAFLMDRDLLARLAPPADAVTMPIAPGAAIGPRGFWARLTAGGAKTDEAAFPALLRGQKPLRADHTPPDPQETAYILFTSGTTSRPKGVEVTRAGLLTHMKTLVRQFGYDAQTRVLNILPLHHADGLLQGPTICFLTGGSFFRPLTFAIDRVPALLDSVYRHRITHMVSVPAMLQLIDTLGQAQKDAFRTADFRFVISTAGYLDPGLWTRFEDVFGTIIVNVYGLTETISESLYCGPDDATRKRGTIGKPVDTETRIVDDNGNDQPPGKVGELWLRGPHIMKGYFKMPAETAEVITPEGWFKTGDLCVVDEDGFYNIVGRKKNVIIVGGMNVYPDDVANILRKVPGVLDAVAWGEPDATWGEIVHAAVTPQPGAQLNEAALAQAYLQWGAVDTLPRRIFIVAEFPRGPAGKVVIRDLQNMLTAKDGAAGATDDDIAHAVFAAAAAAFKCDPAALSPESSAETVKGWSSLAHVEFMLTLEKECGIKIEPRDILSVRSLADAIAVVAARRKAG